MKRRSFFKSMSRGAALGAGAAASASARAVSDMSTPGASLTLSPQAPDENRGLLVIRPGERIRFSAVVEDPLAGESGYTLTGQPRYRWRCSDGRFDSASGSRAEWSPPSQAADVVIDCVYEAEYRPAGLFSALSSVKKVFANAVTTVLAPAPSSMLDERGFIDGYEIGLYPDVNDPQYASHSKWPKKYPHFYKIPDGFYKVTSNNIDRKVTENFTLGNFAHDYPWESLGMPQYIAMDPALMLKLEDLLRAVRADGLARKGFSFLYGFRPPSYNLGTMEKFSETTLKAPFSMHQYGKAVDILIDDDEDLVFDDLDRDGRSTFADAMMLRRYVDALDRDYRSRDDPRLGGAGVYDHHDFRKRKQSPYVHVDVRGFTREDGSLVRWDIRS